MMMSLYRVRVGSVNYRNKQLILEMLPIVVCVYIVDFLIRISRNGLCVRNIIAVEEGVVYYCESCM